MGKGSKQRPLSVDYCSEEQFASNWEKAFGKKKSKDSEAKDNYPVRAPERDSDESGD